MRIAREDLDERKVDLLIDEDGAPGGTPGGARKERKAEGKGRKPRDQERGGAGSRRRRR
ncbi:MAG TPA: hypothetical protein P5525_17895 [Candidatus Paceibacterota bacterium]|nr:hypothetical protein [Candidatus Paceibacterota bacterium]